MKKRTLVIAATATAGIAVAAIPAFSAFADDSEQSAAHWCDTDEPTALYELVSADGSGRLYTLNKAEADKAVSKNDMKLTEEPVAYLPCREFTDSITLERLKPSKEADKWLLARGDGDEADQLEDKGWVNEGVTGFAYRDPKGKVELNRYTNGDEWRIALESDGDELEAAGYKLDGPLGYAYEDAQ